MSDQETAQRLLDRASRRLPSMERAFLQEIAKQSNGTPLPPEAKAWFDRLCEEFKAYLK